MSVCRKIRGAWICEAEAGSDLDYWVDFSKSLIMDDGEEITGLTYEADTGIDVHDQFIDGAKAGYFISTPDAGIYNCSFTATTNNTPPRTAVHSFQIVVR